MAEEKSGDYDVGDGGPALAYVSFVIMDDLLDKLKLLNYDQEFVKKLKMKNLNK